MGLRASARQLLKRVIGESSYENLRHALRVRPYGGLTGARTLSRSSTRAATPLFERFKGSKADLPLASGVQRTTVEIEATNKSPICCNKFLVSDTLQINYVSKTGESSSRMIRTEEVYEYDDGVLVLRAWCFLRKDYRTFVSSRIQSCWDAFSHECVDDVLAHLKKSSLSDPGNVAHEVLSHCSLEIPIAINSLMKSSGDKSYDKRFVQGAKKRALVRWVLGKPRALSLLQTLPMEQREDVEEIVERAIGDTKVTTSTYRSCVGALQKTRYTSHLEFRREELILFIAEAMVGDRAKDSVVNALKQDLLDPSFRIKPGLDDLAEFHKEFKKLKKDSDKAKKKYKCKDKPKTVSSNYRRYERGQPVRVLAIDEALRQLKVCVESERFLLGKVEFEQRVMDVVSAEFTTDEVESKMFSKRLGEGLSTAYCAFGLRKYNSSWFKDSYGKEWLDLKTRSGS
ncbi:transcriptional regulator [Synechococcus sp. AH-601-B19]|nr:transcriptional regulator [Synechococcus sp. AH-601-B19]